MKMDFLYKGQFVEGKMEGFGIKHFPNGNIYEGFFYDNKQHGQGLIKNSKGEVEIEGTWRMGVLI